MAKLAPSPALRRAVGVARLTLVGLIAAAAILAVAAYLQLSQAQEPRPGTAGGDRIFSQAPTLSTTPVVFLYPERANRRLERRSEARDGATGGLSAE